MPHWMWIIRGIIRCSLPALYRFVYPVLTLPIVFCTVCQTILRMTFQAQPGKFIVCLGDTCYISIEDIITKGVLVYIEVYTLSAFANACSTCYIIYRRTIFLVRRCKPCALQEWHTVFLCNSPGAPA